MKGKIDKGGSLLKGLKYQYCPFDREERSCGDWCPHFGEPMSGEKFSPSTSTVMNLNVEPNGLTRLDICHGKILMFDEFKDERKHESE